MEKWKQHTRTLKREVMALYLAYHDPRTPLYGKALAALVVIYAVSPIDLIPDPIPVLGYLDDLVLIPLGALLALRLIPADVMAEARIKAENGYQIGKGAAWAGALLVGGVWVALAIWVFWLLT